MEADVRSAIRAAWYFTLAPTIEDETAKAQKSRKTNAKKKQIG
jgi:hypothetical protein